MPPHRQLHLAAFMRPVSIHTGGWRYPGGWPGANFNFAHLKRFALRLGGYAGLAFVGTPHSIADEMEAWLVERGCDGFNVMFPYLPVGLDDVVDKVVPELQRRGLFRRDYAGTTLRDTLGLPRPVNRFFSS